MKNGLALLLTLTGLGMIVIGLYEEQILNLIDPPPTSTPIRRAAPVELATRTIIWKTVAPYPTFTRVPTMTPYGYTPCDCAGEDVDCPDFATPLQAQACFDYCWARGYRDVFRLDRDKDHQVCEPAR